MRTSAYWQKRYAQGGNSGAGSGLGNAWWKADAINEWAKIVEADSVLDIGCGDGRVAKFLKVPDYLGVDVAPAGLALARRRAPGKAFELLAGDTQPRDMHLSVDVMHHLIEDEAYRAHLDLLFSAHRYAIVYATNYDAVGAKHVRHRAWRLDVPRGWELLHRTTVTPTEGATIGLWARIQVV